MFKHALVGLDFSPATQPFQDCLQDLMPLGTTELTLAYVIDASYPGGSAIAHQEHYERRLAEMQAGLEANGFIVHTEVAVGYPPVQLLETARSHDVSYVVIGSRGHNLAREFLLGSVASEIVERATLPVLLIRLNLAWDADSNRHYCELACRNLTDHVLYVTDFSETAEYAFTYVEKLVEAGSQRVTLLHVQDKGHIERHLLSRLAEFNQIDHERLARLQRNLLFKGATDVKIEIPYGSPVQEILQRIEAGGYSLIVMGSQGRGFVSRVFLGSVSHQIVRHSPVPVLLIPAARS